MRKKIKSKMKGKMKLTVSSASKLLASGNVEKAKVAVGRAISKRLSVEEDDVNVTKISSGRRLVDEKRRLGEKLNIEYEVASSDEKESTASKGIKDKMEKLQDDKSTLVTDLSEAFTEEDLDVTVASVDPDTTVTAEAGPDVESASQTSGTFTLDVGPLVILGVLGHSLLM